MRYSKVFLLLLTLGAYCSWLPSAHAWLGNVEISELAEELHYLIQQSAGVIREPQAHDYIVSLGNRLVRSSDEGNPKDYYFFLVDDADVNAFAGPGGIIGINAGLILSSNNESELAAVMAHEIAHVRQKHMERALAKMYQQRSSFLAGSIAALALSLINPVLGGSAFALSTSTLQQDQINFTRDNEREADRIGIRILYHAGFDPHSMAKFFEKLQRQAQLRYTDNFPAILRTHPLDYERIADAENRASTYPKKTYADSLRFQLFREQIRVLHCSDERKLLTYYHNQRNKHEPALQYGYALALTKADRHTQALDILQPLTQQFPTERTYQIALANATIGAQKIDQGLEQFALLYEIYPDNRAIIINYSQALLDQGCSSKARPILQRAIYTYSGDIALWSALARAQAAEGRKAEAYLARAEALLLMGQPQQAINQLQHAEKLAESNSVRARIVARLEDLE